MAESGKNEEGRSDDRGGGCLRPSREPPNTDPCSSPAVVAGCTPSATERRLPQNIVIQLTGTEGEWHSPEDSELIFSPEPEEDCPLISLSREDEVPEEGKQELVSTTFHVPLSPSSPCSLGSCSSMAGPSFLSPGPPSPTHRPLASLVKSISTELELKEGSTLRPRPLLSLVKSISTEMSRSEPEVSPSKSDSRLNLHLLKQLSPHKGRGGGDSRTVPASPISLSPGWEGPRGGFFKMELEDTKRKLSEAMQEPLSSMFSKLMREESAGSPKHQCRTQGVFQGWEGSMEAGASESPVRSAKRPDADVLPGFNGPCVRHPGRGHHSACPVPHGKPNNRDEELEIYADGDMMQVVALESHKQSARSPASSLLSFRPLTRNSPPTPIPCTSLLCVAMLSFLYFTLPLSPYMSGVALGLAMGFMLGLFLISLGSSRYHSPANASRYKAALLGHGTGNIATNKPDVLKGWMNEIHEYDPETFHPSLTASVFATLEGSCLRLDSPRSNISRRAAYDERHHNATFIKSRSFQLGNSKVFLLPSALASKRVWNPKYPICIRLAEGVTPVGEQAIDGAEEESQREEEPDVELEAQRQRGGGVSRPQPHLLPTTLHLFGRTGREKEEWFHHFTFASLTGTGGEGDGETASRLGDLPTLQSLSPSGQAECGCGSSRAGAAEDEAPSSSPSVQSIPSARVDQTSGGTRCTSLLDYPSFMTHLLAMEQLSPLASPAASSTESSPTLKCTCDLPEYPRMEETAWANALIGRIFWDFLREKYWSDVVSRKIQKKLSKIRLPYFMNDLTLTELDMGSCMPKITAASRPEVNYRGLWVELDVAYTGALQMTLQTKFNLSKLGKEGGQEPYCSDMGVQGCRPILSVLADSDEESSSAGSSDEEEVLLSEPQGAVGDRGAPLVNEGAAGGRTGKKILRFFDKIAKSKYFQKATENEFIRKKIEEMSNTPLLLTVEVKELSGTMVVNIPPPPSDRIWYSFCIPPKLDLRVRPKLGEREVTFCHVTEWIEKKLQQEFQQVFVLPNMDDIYLPLMHSGRSSPPLSHNLSSQSLRSQSSSVESIERIPAEVTGT